MRKIVIFFAALFLGFLMPANAIAQADAISSSAALMTQADKVSKLKNPTTNNPEVKQLEKMLAQYKVTDSSYWTPENSDLTSRGYGQWHDLGGGWKARVDRPAAGDAKPHVHVEGHGKSGAENVDGTNSHGSNLDKAGIPKGVQKKAKALKDYKKGQDDLKKEKAAKSEINRRHLNLKNPAQLAIAIAIFISIVGLVIFAPESAPAWAALLAAI